MAQKKDKKILLLLLLLAAIGTYFIFFYGTKGCKSNSNCGDNYVCTWEGQCERRPDDPWAYWRGEKPDKRCSIEKITDSDCKSFCPIGSPVSHAGAAGFCCYNDEETQALDCDTTKPFFPVETNSQGEVINILPNYPTLQGQSFFAPQAITHWWEKGEIKPEVGTYRDKVANIVSWQAPSSFGKGVPSLEIWLQNIEISPQLPLTIGDSGIMIDAWKIDSMRADGKPIWNSVGLTDLGVTRIIGGTPNREITVRPSQSSYWTSDIFDLNDVATGNYTIKYSYCFRATEWTREKCNDIVYYLEIMTDSLSFQVQVLLG